MVYLTTYFQAIGNYYSTIADEYKVAAELALLQARVQPTDWAREWEVLDRYYTVLKAPQRSKMGDLNRILAEGP